MGRRRRSRPRKMVRRKKTKVTRPQPFYRNLASVIATGVRTLLPGFKTGAAALTDFALKLVSQVIAVTGVDGITTSETNYVGMSGVCGIRYTQIMATSPFVAPADTTGVVNRCKFRTQFLDARLLSLTITVTNVSKLDTRSGMMTIAFLPISDTSDCADIKKYIAANPPTEYSLRRALISRSGPAGSPISITYKPKSTDGVISRFNPIDSCFGVVAVYFNDPLRDAYTSAFTRDAFEPLIQLSGKIALKNSALGTHSIETDDKTEDIVPQTLAEYRYIEPHGWHTLGDDGECLPTCTCGAGFIRDMQI